MTGCAVCGGPVELGESVHPACVPHLLDDLARLICPHGDPLCPCPDGLACHYDGPDAEPPPAGTCPCTVCQGLRELAERRRADRGKET